MLLSEAGIDILLLVIQHDEEGRYPIAERIVRYLIGKQEWSYPCQSKSRAMSRFRRINDWSGLLRTLYDLRSGSGMRWSSDHERFWH
jgi:hypothetical protein